MGKLKFDKRLKKMDVFWAPHSINVIASRFFFVQKTKKEIKFPIKLSWAIAI